MILTCASCSTRYYADDGSIGPDGRNVRCAACGHSWFVAPAMTLSQAADSAPLELEMAGEAARIGLSREQIERARKGAEAAAPPASTAAKARARQAERQRQERMKAAMLAWGATGAAMALSAGGAMLFRQDIAAAWPQAASAYAALGMDVNIAGLEFSEIDVEKVLDGETPMLVVSGAVRNITGAPKPPPILRFSLRNEHAEEVRHWLLEMEGAEIAPGGVRAFRSSLDEPPPGAVDLEATFATVAPRAAPPKAAPQKAAPAPLEAEARRTPAGGPLELMQPLASGADPFPAPIEGLAPRLPVEDDAPHG